jgi:Sulfatase-modifying factor enzyme 1
MQNTAPIGSYEGGKSPYGAYDMAGNVWEWVADWYDANYYRNRPARNPRGPASGEQAGLRLRLHATKCQVMRTQDGIDFLGYRIFPAHRRLRQTTARRFIRRLRLQSKLYSGGMLSLQCIDRSVQSWLGHATHAATYGLRRRVFNVIAFRRTPVPSADSAGEGQAVPGRLARRRVEQ